MRLRICGILSTVDEMQFAALRDTLDINDAACSKHLKVLVDCAMRPWRNGNPTPAGTWCAGMR